MTYLFRSRPVRFQFLFVKFAFEQPAQTRHGFYTVHKAGVFTGMFIALQKKMLI